jgi:iron complex transport system ATP-binding protein
MSTVLHTEALAVGHGRHALLADIHVQTRAGEFTALIGVNGSGKSTLLRTLAGLLPAISGSVRIGDRPLQDMPAAERARAVSVVLTGRPDMGLLDVRTLVSLGRQPWTGRMGNLTSTDHAKVDEALRMTGAEAFEARSLRELSDGESQKVMIARALAQDTPVLLLDEPTAFLDLVNRVRILQLLRTIAHELGKCVLLSTHDLRTALDLCDRILLIDAGRVWSGTPQEAIGSGALAGAFAGSGLVFDPDSAAFRPA